MQFLRRSICSGDGSNRGITGGPIQGYLVSMVNCFSSAFCSCSWWTVREDLLSSSTSGTRKVPDVTGPDSLYIICDSPESRGSMNQTVAPWIDEGRCLPTESSYENLVKSAWQSCCSKQRSKPQLTVISPTISVDYWKSKTKTLMRICYLAQKKAIVSVWGVLRLQPVYPLRLCICSRKRLPYFEHSSPVEIPNSKLEQILAFLSLKLCSRSDPVGDLFEATMIKCSSVPYV
jgi:hypothetical protein